MKPRARGGIEASAIADFEVLAQLAGTRRVTTLRRWLESRRIHYFVNVKGKPATTLAEIDRALNRTPTERIEPNWAALHAMCAPRTGSPLKRSKSPRR